MEYLQLSKVYVNNIHNKAGTQAMSIDGSGRVTKNLIPAFYGCDWSGSAGSKTYSSDTDLRSFTFNEVVVNIDNCWNNTVGEFTCPVAGLYLVTHTVGRRNDSTLWYGAGIYNNDDRIANQWEPPANPADTNMAYLSIHMSGIVNAAANDKISAVYWNNYSSPGSSNANHQNNLAIFLVG
jgi:hypothetical protein